MKTKTKKKIEINQPLLDAILSRVPEAKKQAVQTAVEDFNEIVNEIENSGRIKTTQDYYGDYLGIVRDATALLLFRAAGAGMGAVSAARINHVICYQLKN